MGRPGSKTDFPIASDHFFCERMVQARGNILKIINLSIGRKVARQQWRQADAKKGLPVFIASFDEKAGTFLIRSGETEAKTRPIRLIAKISDAFLIRPPNFRQPPKIAIDVPVFLTETPQNPAAYHDARIMMDGNTG